MSSDANFCYRYLESIFNDIKVFSSKKILYQITHRENIKQQLEGIKNSLLEYKTNFLVSSILILIVYLF